MKSVKMKSIKAKIVIEKPESLPKYQTEGAACADVVACIPRNIIDGVDLGDKVMMKRHTPISIKTGMKVAIPDGYKLCIAARSGLAKKGLIVLNGVGQIDSDYRGEIAVLMMNCGPEILYINNGDRIAQCWIEPVYKIDWEVVEKLDDTARGSGGFGSTGVSA